MANSYSTPDATSEQQSLIFRAVTCETPEQLAALICEATCYPNSIYALTADELTALERMAEWLFDLEGGAE